MTWIGRIWRMFAANDAGGDGGTATRGKASVACNVKVGDDGWVDVAAVGDHPHPKVGNQHVTVATLESLARQVAQSAADPDWPGIPFFVGHPWDAPSLAWAKQARVVNGVLQLLPEWSSEGQSVMANRQFKGLSVCWYGDYDEAGNFIPDEIDHVGLTNRPNMSGLRPPVNAEEPPFAESAAGAGDAAKLATDAAAANAWTDDFVGEIRALLADASDVNEAMDILWRKWAALDEARRNVEALEQLVASLGQALGVSPGEGGIAEVATGLLEAANGAVDRATRLGRELEAVNAAFSGFVVDQAVARGIVAASNRERALQSAANDRTRAIEVWFSPAAGELKRPQPPACPVSGAGNFDPHPAGRLPRTVDQAAVANAVEKIRRESPQTSYQAAHAQAWRELYG